MEIFEVAGSVVCSRRHAGLGLLPLRLLKDRKGKYQVAVDTIGSQTGNWVFSISGSAARLALDDKTIMTDLTVGGIMDSGKP